MNDNIPIENFKVVLLGESGVGKTSIISQFIESSFQEDLQSSTGGTFFSKTFICDKSKIIKFEIWDTAGQERYRSLTKMFYKDAGAAVLVYDITSKKSFEELKNYWAEQIKESAPSNIIISIVANKSDLSEIEVVDEETARNYATEIGALFCTASAKNCCGINDLFIQIAQKHTGSDHIKIKGEEDDLSNTINQTINESKNNGSMRINSSQFGQNEKKKKCC